MQLVQLAREADHRAAAEGHDDRAGAQAGDRAAARPIERRLALEEADLGLGKRVPDERQRLDRAEQQDVPVLPAEQEPRPRRAALLVLRPLDLVEHERLAARRRHLGGAADDRRVGIDSLLSRYEADAALAELGREASVRLLREHAQRRCIDALPAAASGGEVLPLGDGGFAAVASSSTLHEKPQGVVRLAGVGRAEVRDHRLRLDAPLGQADGQLRDGSARRLPTAVALAPARSLLPLMSASSHEATVAARPGGTDAASRRSRSLRGRDQPPGARSR